jgi:hypothetical protein
MVDLGPAPDMEKAGFLKPWSLLFDCGANLGALRAGAAGARCPESLANNWRRLFTMSSTPRACALSSMPEAALSSAVAANCCVTCSIRETARAICSMPRACCSLPPWTSSTRACTLVAALVTPVMEAATSSSFCLPSAARATESSILPAVSLAAGRSVGRGCGLLRRRRRSPCRPRRRGRLRRRR